MYTDCAGFQARVQCPRLQYYSIENGQRMRNCEHTNTYTLLSSIHTLIHGSSKQEILHTNTLDTPEYIDRGQGMKCKGRTFRVITRPWYSLWCIVLGQVRVPMGARGTGEPHDFLFYFKLFLNFPFHSLNSLINIHFSLLYIFNNCLTSFKANK